MKYEVVRETPSVDDYLRLRREAGLGGKSLEAAQRGLPNTIFAAQVRHNGRMVAMCRLVGDGGLQYAAVDGAVAPDYQGEGLGKIVVGEVVNYFKDTAPPGAYMIGVTGVPGFMERVGFEIVREPEYGVYVWQPMEGDR